jgi:predicted RNase H-like nuclease (RuvC/YqgF family)
MKKYGKNRPKEKNSLLDSSYTNNVLLDLRRRYSKIEAVKMIEEENSNLRIELGKITSYCNELEDKLSLFEGQTPADIALWKIERKRDSEICGLKADLEKVTKDKNHWSTMYFRLLAKNLNNSPVSLTSP